MEELIQRLRDKQGWAKIIGRAPGFLNAIAKLPAIAKTDAAVLISGETGTGKELIARAIHYSSNRGPCPFIAINCGAMPDTLLESELFGHERGAFTDARDRKRGLIEEARTGTLFLDEIDSLSPKGQVTLLRVIQDKKFRPVGSTLEKSADIRVIAATNARLTEFVHSGHFRSDLYYRLSVFAIRLPPLRDRKEDILVLAEHFLAKHTPTHKSGVALAPDAQAALISNDWPGNIRELENAIIRGIYLTETNVINEEHLGLESATHQNVEPVSSLKIEKQLAIQQFELSYLHRIMLRHGGNISHAAQAAGKERREFGKLLRKYGLDAKAFRMNLLFLVGALWSYVIDAPSVIILF